MIVINTESTTHINMLYKNLACLKFILQFVNPITKSNKITHIEYLRTNMKVQTDTVDMLHPQSPIYHFVHIFHTDTKLILSESGSDICMGMCTYIGVDTKSNIRYFSFGSSQFAVSYTHLAQRFRIIVTDGVFSMDGNVAPMDKICDLAEKYDALVMVDESHSAGVVGATGHGVSELYKTYGRVDIYTGTLGKAFGGALGGFTTGRKEIIDLLRQRSRPYLFSNSLAPGIIGASLEVFKMLKESKDVYKRQLLSRLQFISSISCIRAHISSVSKTTVAVGGTSA